ncbi:MAG: hypothetical protein PHX86_05830 [Caldisericia bacterium]|nr:hypothetical protein [Caldisericia bacterium]
MKHNTLPFYLVLSLVLVCLFFYFQYSRQTFAQGSLEKMWQMELDCNISAHTVSSKGKYIAVGDTNGMIRVYTQDGSEYFTHQFEDPILDLQFSFDETSVLVRCYSIYCIDLTEQRIVWEKFYQPEQYFIENFWVFQDGKIGYLASSLTKLESIYFLTNSEGVTIEEPKNLPMAHVRCQTTPSPDGKLLVWTTEEGTIECISYYGFVHWNKQVSFSNRSSSDPYPFLQDINNNGDICISFPQMQVDTEMTTSLLINIEGIVLWERTTKDPVQTLAFSHKRDTILIGTQKEVQLFDLSGNLLHTKKVFGYQVKQADVFYSHLLIQYQPTSEIRPRSFQKGIVELNWLDNIVWRKHTIETTKTEFSIADNGYVFLEVSYPQTFSFYKFHFNKTQRKV